MHLQGTDAANPRKFVSSGLAHPPENQQHPQTHMQMVALAQSRQVLLPSHPSFASCCGHLLRFGGWCGEVSDTEAPLHLLVPQMTRFQSNCPHYMSSLQYLYNELI